MQLNEVLAQVQKETGITPAEIMGPAKRHSPATKARWRAIHLLRAQGWRRKEIAHALRLHPKTIDYATSHAERTS